MAQLRSVIRYTLLVALTVCTALGHGCKKKEPEPVSTHAPEQKQEAAPPPAEPAAPQANPEPSDPAPEPATPASPEPATPASDAPAEARYDEPAEPGTSANDPPGHAVVLAGYDLQASSIDIIDPADNLVDGVGRHDWSGDSSRLVVRASGRSLQITLDDRPATIFAAVVLRSSGAQQSAPQTHRQSGVPDLSQHAGGGWQNFCVPTAAANLIFSAARQDNTLRAFLLSRAAAGRDGVATDVIAGIDAPPALEKSLSGYMKTSAQNGTLNTDIVTGLQRFLDEHAGSQHNWRAEYLESTAATSPEAWYRTLCTACGQGSGVLLLVVWEPGSGGVTEVADGSPGGVPPGLLSESGPEPMTAEPPSGVPGSPALPAGIPESAAPDSETQSPTPASSPAQSGINRGTVTADVELPDLPPAVVLPALPGKPAPVQRNVALIDPKLVGSWRQVAGERSADFAEGGYQDGTMVITSDGVITITRQYGSNSVRIRRKFSIEQTVAGQVRISIPEAKDTRPLLTAPLTLRAPDGTSVTVVPPTTDAITLPVAVSGSTLKLGDKTYVKF